VDLEALLSSHRDSPLLQEVGAEYQSTLRRVQSSQFFRHLRVGARGAGLLALPPLQPFDVVNIHWMSPGKMRRINVTVPAPGVRSQWE
jgi:hypothetical protein